MHSGHPGRDGSGARVLGFLQAPPSVERPGRSSSLTLTPTLMDTRKHAWCYQDSRRTWEPEAPKCVKTALKAGEITDTYRAKYSVD